MNFAPVIITCPGREEMLEITQASWRATDFSDQRLLVKLDLTTFEQRQERQMRNSLAAIRQALAEFPKADFVLFMEDDIIFNRHLRHNLENWMPLQRAMESKTVLKPDIFFFASLYNCSIREIERQESERYFIADPNTIYGSQCFVASVSLAHYFAAHWDEVGGMQDIKMSRLAARLCPIYYYIPSLVQHVGVNSAWGGHFHYAEDFDQDFKATPATPDGAPS